MVRNLFRNYIFPVAVFSSGMVGVGFLSLPHIAMQTGIWMMAFYFFILVGISLLIHIIYCQISLKTPDFKRFPGFVGYYLGSKAQIFSWVLMIFGSIGTFLIYLLVGSEFLAKIFQPLFGGSLFFYVFLYFFAVSIVIYLDIKFIARIQLIVLVFFFLSLLFVFFRSLLLLRAGNIFVQPSLNLETALVPYGPLLFAFWGIGLIPETEEMLVRKKGNLKRIIVASTIIVAAFYFLFMLFIIGITGPQTDPTALAGLKNFLGNGMMTIFLFAATLAIFAAFIAQGTVFKKTLVFDMKIKHWQAFIITCCPPMILFLLGFRSFIDILSFIGGVFLGITGIIILLMYRKIGGKKNIIYPLLIIFILGIIYQIIFI